jgi:ferredoxin
VIFLKRNYVCTIVPEECIACGLCAVYAPELFDYDDDGLVKFVGSSDLVKEISADYEAVLLQSYRKCPVRAIQLKKTQDD